MSQAEILAAIPHRPPMLFLMRSSPPKAESSAARTFASGRSFSFGAYNQLVPGVILCEATMQAGNCISDVARGGDTVPVAGRMSDVKFEKNDPAGGHD